MDGWMMLIGACDSERRKAARAWVCLDGSGLNRCNRNASFRTENLVICRISLFTIDSLVPTWSIFQKPWIAGEQGRILRCIYVCSGGKEPLYLWEAWNLFAVVPRCADFMENQELCEGDRKGMGAR